MSGSKLLIILPLLGTLIGGMWGGFELYNRLLPLILMPSYSTLAIIYSYCLLLNAFPASAIPNDPSVTTTNDV